MMDIKIYQVNMDRDTDRVAFMGLHYLERLQNSKQINSSVYDKVYEGKVNATDLEDVYRIFNLEHPIDYRGRSLSVSDVVQVISAESDKNFYFCDSFGFKRVDFDPDKTQVFVPFVCPEQAVKAAIYLKAEPDATWKACIASEAPDGFVKLCDEGAYPAHLYYERYDINGSGITERDICNNREDLLESLKWFGECRDTILSLWDFKYSRGMDPVVSKIFSDAYAKLGEIARSEMEAFYEEEEPPAVPAKTPLSEKIQSAGKVVESKPKPAKNLESERDNERY